MGGWLCLVSLSPSQMDRALISDRGSCFRWKTQTPCEDTCQGPATSRPRPHAPGREGWAAHMKTRATACARRPSARRGWRGGCAAGTVVCAARRLIAEGAPRAPAPAPDDPLAEGREGGCHCLLGFRLPPRRRPPVRRPLAANQLRR